LILHGLCQKCTRLSQTEPNESTTPGMTNDSVTATSPSSRVADIAVSSDPSPLPAISEVSLAVIRDSQFVLCCDFRRHSQGNEARSWRKSNFRKRSFFKSYLRRFFGTGNCTYRPELPAGRSNGQGVGQLKFRRCACFLLVHKRIACYPASFQSSVEGRGRRSTGNSTRTRHLVWIDGRQPRSGCV